MNRLATSSLSAPALMFAMITATPGQEARETIPVRINVANKAGVNPDNLRIQAWLVVEQRRYQLDLGGDSPTEFRGRLAKLAADGAQYPSRHPHHPIGGAPIAAPAPEIAQFPAPPEVNLALVLKNVGGQPLSFAEPGRDSPLHIVLEGKGAVNVGQPRPDDARKKPDARWAGLAPMALGERNTFIRPNESIQVPIRTLQSVPGGAPSYWTEPGDYIVKVEFTTAIEDIYGRIKWRGVTFQSDPIKLTVTPPAESPPRRFAAHVNAALPPAAVGLRDVDPRNWQATASQLQERQKEARALLDVPNPRAKEAGLEMKQAHLDRFIGTQVEWTFPLHFVTAAPPGKFAVVPDVAQSSVNLQMTTEREIPGVRQKGFNPLRFISKLPMLVEGHDIPAEDFKKLGKADSITVSGHIERIFINTPFNMAADVYVLLADVTARLGEKTGPAGKPVRMLDDKIESFGAVELNHQLSNNEIRAAEFSGKTIEVTGQYFGSKIIKPANGDPKVAYLVTFKGYAGLSECSHIKCFFFDKPDLVGLKPGDMIKVRGKVSVKGDVVGIEAKLVE